MMAIVWWIIFGLVVGLLARAIMPGRQNMSTLMTILLGIVGSLVGGGISWLFGGAPQGGFSPAGFILSIIGAILALYIYSRVKKGT